MNILTFQGYSDDTFACEGGGIDVDYDTCASGEAVKMLVRGEGGALLVISQYDACGFGGWQIAVSPYDPDGLDDESTHIPDWPISIMRTSRPYSPALVITAPDNVSVRLID